MGYELEDYLNDMLDYSEEWQDLDPEPWVFVGFPFGLRYGRIPAGDRDFKFDPREGYEQDRAKYPL